MSTIFLPLKLFQLQCWFRLYWNSYVYIFQNHYCRDNFRLILQIWLIIISSPPWYLFKVCIFVPFFVLIDWMRWLYHTHAVCCFRIYIWQVYTNSITNQSIRKFRNHTDSISWYFTIILDVEEIYFHSGYLQLIRNAISPGLLRNKSSIMIFTKGFFGNR